MASGDRRDQYTIEKVIGSGKFSIVYSARRKSDNGVVALKSVQIYDIMDANDRNAYLNEVALLEQLTHPNIVSYLDSFVEDNKLFIVMELAEVGDLSKLIKRAKERDQPLAEKTIWKLFYQVAAGLKYMHEQRIMHRDLKPANVFVGTGGKVKLGDLGLGRCFSSKTTAADSLVGTPYYMSPERIHESAYEFKSDIWSLGCLLYEMAALQNPFYAEEQDLMSLFHRIDRCEYPPLPEGYSDTLKELVASIIVANPSDRPDTAEVYETAKAMVETYMKAAAGGDA